MGLSVHMHQSRIVTRGFFVYGVLTVLCSTIYNVRLSNGCSWGLCLSMSRRSVGIAGTVNALCLGGFCK